MRSRIRWRPRCLRLCVPRRFRLGRRNQRKTGLRRLLDWRWLLGIGAVAAAAGAARAVTMRRRYASATAAANDATESSEGERQADGTDSDAAMRSEVNGRVTTPGN